MKEKVLKIINNYGVIPQLKYMQTEMFEFIEAIIKYETEIHYCDYIADGDFIEMLKRNIEEEYADLMVMLEQFYAYYKLDDMHISEVMHQKIDRQLERIKEGK